MRPLILSRHIVMPINPLILFPVPEKKNKTKIKKIFVDSAQLKKKKKRNLTRLFSCLELTVI